MTLHISQFEGGNALSDFRARQLLPQLQAIHDRIIGLAARHVHLVASDQPPEPADHTRLAALLVYGDPYQGPNSGALLVEPCRPGPARPLTLPATAG